MGSLPAVVNEEKRRESGCEIRHNENYVRCCKACVYSIPLSCGKEYIGQTGRCINTRLREHKYKAKCREGNISEHGSRCGCGVEFIRTEIVGRFGGAREREIWEAFLIAEAGEECVSCASIGLSTKERDFLRLYVP